ncbi:MAG: sugar transferase, partial [Ktedonobacterales bacterium]
MDVDQQQLQAAMSAPPDITQPAAVWPAAQARPVLPVYSVEDRLRRRGIRLAIGRLAMAGLDVVMLNVAVIAAYYIRYVALRGVAITTVFVPEPFAKYQSLEILVTVGMLASFTIRGLYRLRSTGTWFKQFWTIAGTTTMAFAIFSAYNYVFHGTDLFVDQNRSLVAFTWITVIVGVSLARLIIALILSGLYKRGVGLTNLIVVGSSRLGKLMMQHIAASTYLGYRVVGFIHDSDDPPSDFGRFKVLGTMRDLDTVIRGNRISDVVIALPSHQHQQIMRAVRVCERAGADFKLVPDLYELSLSRIDVDAIEGIPLIGLRRSLTNTWQYRVKRLIDVLGALAALILTAPIWALISLAIKLDSPGPVLLKQTRLGYRGQPFGCYKFRSMYTNADQMLRRLREQNGGDERGKFKLKHDPRRTRVGRFIRRASIDELPQILNVLRGEMSLVGPRPPVPDEYERYEDWEKARLEMPPGITGLWQ